MIKEKVRNECLDKRNDLTKEEVDKYSSIIFDKVKPYLKHDLIAVYHSYGKEVQTIDIINEILMNKKVAIPVTQGMGKMNFYLADKNTTYKKSFYGIKEPVSSEMIDPKDIDVIIIPLVGFDELKQRIGHGMAYYDRYLARCSKAIKIGLAFECQKVHHIAVDEHDIPLDLIITEKQIYE